MVLSGTSLADSGGIPGSSTFAPPPDRNDASSPRSASAASDPRFEIEDLSCWAEPEPQKEVRCQQCEVMAVSTIDLKVALRRFLIRARQRLHSGLRAMNVRGPHQRIAFRWDLMIDRNSRGRHPNHRRHQERRSRSVHASWSPHLAPAAAGAGRGAGLPLRRFRPAAR